MDARTLLLDSLNARWDKYREIIKVCRREFSDEAVHDLRVAARRLLALVDLLRTLAPHPRLQKIRAALKRQLDEFDDLRDTQVMLAEISENIDSLPDLQPFQVSLKKRERRLLRDAAEVVDGLKLGGLARRIEKVRAGLTEQAASPVFDGNTLRAVDDAYATVLQRYGWIDPQQPPTIHHTRVAFKKFRYMVEVVHPLLPGFPAANLKRMHDYQTSMGEIQDVEVFLNVLADFSDSAAPEAVLHFYQRRHAELIAIFFEDKGEVASFWRPDPLQQFPWEPLHESLPDTPRHRRGTGRRARRTAPADREGAQEDAQDRPRIEHAGDTPQPGLDQPAGAGA